MPNSPLNSNNSPNPLVNLRISRQPLNQHSQRPLQLAFFLISALPMPLDFVDQRGQSRQFLEIVLHLQGEQSRICRDVRFG